MSGVYARMSRKMNVAMGKIENKKTVCEPRAQSTDDGIRASENVKPREDSSESGADCTSDVLGYGSGYGVSVRVEVKTMLMFLGV